MRVEVADRAVPLAEDRDMLPALARATQARSHVGEFLAEGRRARGLAVRA